MEAFESIVGMLLEREGYWVRGGFRVQLTHRDKARLNRPNCPRWEVDLLAYKAFSNELLVVECKSYLDSAGVKHSAVFDNGNRDSSRFKLFNDPRLREVVLARLEEQLLSEGLCKRSPSIVLCLAAGKIADGTNAEKLKRDFKKRDWRLFDVEWVRERLRRIAQSRYEDATIAEVAKLLLRGGIPSTHVSHDKAEL